MEVIFERLQGLLIFTAVLLALGLLAYGGLQRQVDSPGAEIVKWVLTGVVGYGYFFHLKPMTAVGGPSALVALLLALLVGLILAIIWVPPILNFITRPIMDLFIGGWFVTEKRPFYALAKGRRKRGEFTTAIEEIDKQLCLFPGSAEGRLLKAEIQAEDIGDVDAAADTIDELVEREESNPEVAPPALMRLADWRLRLGGDPEAAEAALQGLIGLFPESEVSAAAQTLLRRLPDRARLKANPSLRDALQPRKTAKRVRVTAKAIVQPDTLGAQATPDRAECDTIRIVESDRKKS
jgi:tetratricopeptide (TPR) repeat protein